MPTPIREVEIQNGSRQPSQKAARTSVGPVRAVRCRGGSLAIDPPAAPVTWARSSVTTSFGGIWVTDRAPTRSGRGRPELLVTGRSTAHAHKT